MMQLHRRRSLRLLLQFLCSSFIVFTLGRFIPYQSPVPVTHATTYQCNFVLIAIRPATRPRCNFMPATPASPCRWQLNVTSIRNPNPHPLLLANHPFSDAHLALLSRLDGCTSQASCDDQQVPCAYGQEDPSDALWLRDYNFGSKFVVFFRLGLVSLILYILAILADGSIFYPHRPGAFSLVSGTVVFLIAVASLLYLLLVPQHLQLSLYGAGFKQTIAYCLLILSIAAVLPAVAIVWLSFSLLMIYFVGFLIEQIFCMAAGILHFLGALCIFHFENALLHMRLIYLRDIEEEDDLDRRLLALSRNFLHRMRENWFLARIPDALEEDGLQIVETTLPALLYEELIQEDRIPHIDFDQVDIPSTDRRNRRRGDPSASTPLLTRSASR